MQTFCFMLSHIYASPASLMRHLIMHFRTACIVWTFVTCSCLFTWLKFVCICPLFRVCVIYGAHWFNMPHFPCMLFLYFFSLSVTSSPHPFLFLVHFVNFVSWSCDCPFGTHSTQTKVKDWILVIIHFHTQKGCFSVWKDNL